MSIHTAQLPTKHYGARGLCSEGELVRPSRENFGENLSELLRKARISGAELGRRIGRSSASVSRWCDGTQEPSFEDKDAIAKALGVPVAKLYEDPTDTRTTGLEIDKAIRMVVEAAKKGSSQ